MSVIITLIVFILLILLIVWGHFLTRDKADDVDQDIRDKTNKALYIEHKEEIERDYQQGNIDEENYQYLLAELDKSLLQDMQEAQLAEDNVKTDKQVSYIWPSVISVFILVFSFAVYNHIGAFEQLSQPKHNGHANLDAEQQAGLARLEQLKSEISANPDNSDLWYTLGQELVALGDFENAMTAFDKTIEIEGEKADLIGAKAQAAYYKNGQQMVAEVQALVNKALSLDASDASTNILLGMHAFGLAQYQEAINYWQSVIDAGKPVNVAAIEQAIDEAKRRLNQPASSASPKAQQAPQEISEKAVAVAVSFANDIREKLIAMEDKTVFVYAVPANGPRMPVAAIKLSASDLPVTLNLDDSRAMNPQMKISNFDTVNVFAVVSMQGTPGTKPGDFVGQQDGVSVSKGASATIVIDTIAE